MQNQMFSLFILLASTSMISLQGMSMSTAGILDAIEENVANFTTWQDAVRMYNEKEENRVDQRARATLERREITGYPERGERLLGALVATPSRVPLLKKLLNKEGFNSKEFGAVLMARINDRREREVGLLLEIGVPLVIDFDFKSGLMRALLHRTNTLPPFSQESFNIAQIILSHPEGQGSVNQQDEFGQTVLWEVLAFQGKSYESVKPWIDLFIENGADPYIASNSSYNVLDVIPESNDREKIKDYIEMKWKEYKSDNQNEN